MQGRGSNKRHTLALGSSEETQRMAAQQPAQQTNSQPRTRRSGLLTVMERPPGKFSVLYCCNHCTFFKLSVSKISLKKLLCKIYSTANLCFVFPN